MNFHRDYTISKPNFKGSITGNTKIYGNTVTTDNKITLNRINGIPSASNDYLGGRIFTQKNIETKLFKEPFNYKLFCPNEISDQKTEVENFILSELNLDTADSLGVINVNEDLIIKGNLITKPFSKAVTFYVKGNTIIKDSTYSKADITIKR